MDPELLDRQKDTYSSELKVAKLAAVEKLLWGINSTEDASLQGSGRCYASASMA